MCGRRRTGARPPSLLLSPSPESSGCRPAEHRPGQLVTRMCPDALRILADLSNHRLYFDAHSSTHPEGWRDMALRSPGNLPQGNGANSIRLQHQGLGDVERAVVHRPPTTDPGGGFFTYAARVSSLQRM